MIIMTQIQVVLALDLGDWTVFYNPLNLTAELSEGWIWVSQSVTSIFQSTPSETEPQQFIDQTERKKGTCSVTQEKVQFPCTYQSSSLNKSEPSAQATLRDCNTCSCPAYHMRQILQGQLCLPAPPGSSSVLRFFCASYHHNAAGPQADYRREHSRAGSTCSDRLPSTLCWRMTKTLLQVTAELQSGKEKSLLGAEL